MRRLMALVLVVTACDGGDRTTVRMDFTNLESEDDVHFAHARGFVSKTSATEPDRLKQLLATAFVGDRAE